MAHDISKLGLSIRAYNCLRKNGINTVEEVAELSDDDLLSIHRMGPKTLEDIKTRLKIFLGEPTYEDLKTENALLSNVLLCIMTCNCITANCPDCPIQGGKGVVDIEDYCDELIALINELNLK